MGGLRGAAFATVSVLLLFLCVTLHELGHSLMARRLGVRVKDITLLPIGGVARLETMPEKPSHELLIAAVGPLVNFVIALGLGLALLFMMGTRLFFNLGHLARLLMGPDSFLSLVIYLLSANLVLGVFNLIPAFPMDGGRVLRSLLAMRMEYPRATRIAATVGQGMAVIFGIVGLFSNPFLVFIAFFVWVGAAQEASMVQTKSALEGMRVSQLMLTDFQALAPLDSLGRAVHLILRGSQTDFPVVENGTVLGVLTRGDIMTALSRQGEYGRVSDVMRRDFQLAEADEMLEPVLLRLQSAGTSTIPVTLRGKLVGLLTSENIRKFLMIQSALSKVPGRDGLVRDTI
jgi:Zn-dependent protease/CBS domain-containing protein